MSGHWQQTGSLVKGLFSSVGQSGLAVAAWVANLVLIPVVMFYLLRDWDVMMDKIGFLLPRNVEKKVTLWAQECDEVLGAFIKGQLLVMLALGVIYSLGLWSVGLDLALLVGMLAGLASIVPYMGFIVGIVAAGVAAMLQFNDLTMLAWVGVVFAIGQALEGMVLTPLLVGDRIGLHPVAVIFAIMAGGQLFGFVGILIALPVAAVIMVLLRHLHQGYKSSKLYDC
jgi:predicted PurR-regulated permease PerM